MQTIRLTFAQQLEVKTVYANLNEARCEFDAKWREAELALVEIANDLGLPNLGNTSWGQDYTELYYADH